jgi:hypothetical protein
LERLREITDNVQALQAEVLSRTPQPAAEAGRAAPPRGDNGAGGKLGPAAAGGPQPAAAAQPSAAPPPRPPGTAEEGMHDLIIQRLEALQQERQGRWQSILQSLLGKRPD